MRGYRYFFTWRYNGKKGRAFPFFPPPLLQVGPDFVPFNSYPPFTRPPPVITSGKIFYFVRTGTLRSAQSETHSSCSLRNGQVVLK